MRTIPNSGMVELELEKAWSGYCCFQKQMPRVAGHGVCLTEATSLCSESSVSRERQGMSHSEKSWSRGGDRPPPVPHGGLPLSPGQLLPQRVQRSLHQPHHPEGTREPEGGEEANNCVTGSLNNPRRHLHTQDVFVSLTLGPVPGLSPALM